MPQIEIANDAVKLFFSPRQSEALDTLEVKDEVLYGGAKGGGKSVLLVRWAFLLARKIIELCKLSPTRYPIPVGFLGRKRGVDFNDTTLETWKRFVPAGMYNIRTQEKEIIIENTVKIHYGGLDDELRIKKFNSAEYAFIGVDQAEEITRDDYGMLKGTLRLVVNEVKLFRKMLFTANPAPGWLKDDFILSPQSFQKFIQSLPKDNPFIDVEAYVKTLKDAFRHRPEMVQALVFGSWDEVEAQERAIIKHSWVLRAVNRANFRPDRNRVVVSCDPARYGDDETIIYCFKEGELIDEKIFGQRSLMETAGEIVIMEQKHEASLIAVDAIGLGAGLVDRLREMGKPVMEINSASASSNRKKFKNLRAQMWWEAGELFYLNEVSIPDDRVLIGQLSSMQYDEITSEGSVRVWTKEKHKERIGKSPDRADALIYGLYALKFAGMNQDGSLEPQPWKLGSPK